MRVIDDARHRVGIEIFAAFAGVEFGETGVDRIGSGIESRQGAGRTSGRGEQLRRRKWCAVLLFGHEWFHRKLQYEITL